ncbi:MAG: serine--tRNA ligase [Hoeflea sp.]|uniref:serine--tRNA ligase n=1 Tax=Hoeflea sp. TaxID=1940281 RepID=UPI001DAA7A68|nr:serine--tRNA ligase [Hoeflea sp.]MBU4530708.1 serine--tRNA ligase [Alphaproteobacteria bacterium]MBU4544928.1 serine--tRNA ligase [Alphaproteobacteria bacterium]MBU4552071.1 serine--tRNA ligase [Alphaproteobacteria bacterium]MBV1722260.1 serine--tRNA ligase [Hoeflea sp.]MBV1761822.1 serine--tRNA ligase [Hoeflea sp.]
MLDIKWIRDNPAALDAALAKRGAAPQAASLIELDEARRSHVGLLQALQERRNLASKEIGKAMAAKDQATADSLKAEVATIKDELQAGEAKERDLDEALKHALSVLPNIPLDEVPVGTDESGNVEVRKVGAKPDLGFKPREHYELGEALGMMDFERAAKMSGARFTILTGGLARLERALGQFMLDLHTAEHGYTEVNPPLMVNDAAAYGTDKLPKFGDDLFRTTDGRWLIPTAEVPLTYMAAGEIIADDELPKRYAAQTACFRSEAGSAGRDTRGMLRQHQFTKVELVSVTTPETSLEEHERMTASAENVLKRLGLHFRTIVLCTGDMGFGAQKTYDIEVWLPGQEAYREISSCSVCGDFQARRMNARCRKPGDKATRFVHTLNGSGVAVGRALIAVMENYQNADGSITVPDVLQPYMGGLTRIEKAA